MTSTSSYPEGMENLSARALLMESNITMKGWMLKKSGRNKLSLSPLGKYDKRFFIIYNGWVYYYVSENSEKPQNSFSLEGYSKNVTPAHEEYSTALPYVFKVYPRQEGKRTWFFAPDTKELMNSWRDAFKLEIEKYNVTTSIPAIRPSVSMPEKSYVTQAVSTEMRPKSINGPLKNLRLVSKNSLSSSKSSESRESVSSMLPAEQMSPSDCTYYETEIHEAKENNEGRTFPAQPQLSPNLRRELALPLPPKSSFIQENYFDIGTNSPVNNDSYYETIDPPMPDEFDPRNSNIMLAIPFSPTKPPARRVSSIPDTLPPEPPSNKPEVEKPDFTSNKTDQIFSNLCDHVPTGSNKPLPPLPFYQTSGTKYDSCLENNENLENVSPGQIGTKDSYCEREENSSKRHFSTVSESAVVNDQESSRENHRFSTIENFFSDKRIHFSNQSAMQRFGPTPPSVETKPKNKISADLQNKFDEKEISIQKLQLSSPKPKIELKPVLQPDPNRKNQELNMISKKVTPISIDQSTISHSKQLTNANPNQSWLPKPSDSKRQIGRKPFAPPVSVKPKINTSEKKDNSLISNIKQKEVVIEKPFDSPKNTFNSKSLPDKKPKKPVPSPNKPKPKSPYCKQTQQKNDTLFNSSNNQKPLLQSKPPVIAKKPSTSKYVAKNFEISNCNSVEESKLSKAFVAKNLSSDTTCNETEAKFSAVLMKAKRFESNASNNENRSSFPKR